jgi:hypothetical protein
LCAADLESLASNGIGCLKDSGHESADMLKGFGLSSSCWQPRDFEFFMDCTELGEIAGREPLFEAGEG